MHQADIRLAEDRRDVLFVDEGLEDEAIAQAALRGFFLQRLNLVAAAPDEDLEVFQVPEVFQRVQQKPKIVGPADGAGVHGAEAVGIVKIRVRVRKFPDVPVKRFEINAVVDVVDPVEIDGAAVLPVPAVFPDVVRGALHGEDHGIRPAVHELFPRIEKLPDRAVPLHRAVGHQRFRPEVADLADAGHLEMPRNLLPGKNSQRMNRRSIDHLRRAKLPGIFFRNRQEVHGEQQHILDP